MRTTLYPAFHHEFIAVSGESRPGLPPNEATRDLFTRVDTALHVTAFPWRTRSAPACGVGAERRATAAAGSA
jgi:hypothetical protein